MYDYIVAFRGCPEEQYELVWCVYFWLLWNCGIAPLIYVGLGWFNKVCVSKLKQLLPLWVVLCVSTLILSWMTGALYSWIFSLRKLADWPMMLVLYINVFGLCPRGKEPRSEPRRMPANVEAPWDPFWRIFNRLLHCRGLLKICLRASPYTCMHTRARAYSIYTYM